jgi:hypothetical protein
MSGRLRNCCRIGFRLPFWTDCMNSTTTSFNQSRIPIKAVEGHCPLTWINEKARSSILTKMADCWESLKFQCPTKGFRSGEWSLTSLWLRECESNTEQCPLARMMTPKMMWRLWITSSTANPRL